MLAPLGLWDICGLLFFAVGFLAASKACLSAAFIRPWPSSTLLETFLHPDRGAQVSGSLRVFSKSRIAGVLRFVAEQADHAQLEICH